MNALIQQQPQAIAAAVEQWLIEAIERQEAIRPAHETRVRNTLDLLRTASSDPALVRRFEDMSCTLARLEIFRRQGRVNAYASALRRLEHTARAA